MLTATATEPLAHEQRTGAMTLELMKLAVPMIGMTLSRMLMGLIDFFAVSHLGTAAQAAISPSTLLLFTIACVGMGMAQGVQAFVSQADGRGQPERAGVYLSQSLWIAVVAAIITAPLVYTMPIWFAWVAHFGRHDPDVATMEVDFLRIALWSIGPMTACAGLESFFNGVKRPWIGFLAVASSLLTIALGNYVLVFGHWGFPKMGIAGSGLATLLAWCVRLAVLLIPLLFSPSLDARYHVRRAFGVDFAKLREIVRVGGPISVQWLVDIGAWFLFLQIMMPPYGKAAMAGANVAIQFMHLSFMPIIGLGMALTTQVGNAIGAGNPELAEARVRVARRLIVGFMGIVALLMVLTGQSLVGLMCFETDPAIRAEVLKSAAAILLWVALFQVSDAVCITYSFALRGAGDTAVSAKLFVICCWGIFVVGGLAVQWLLPGTGFHGPWAMCALYIIVLGVLLWWRFASGAWRTIRLIKDPEPPATSD